MYEKILKKLVEITNKMAGHCDGGGKQGGGGSGHCAQLMGDGIRVGEFNSSENVTIVKEQAMQLGKKYHLGSRGNPDYSIDVQVVHIFEYPASGMSRDIVVNIISRNRNTEKYLPIINSAKTYLEYRGLGNLGDNVFYMPEGMFLRYDLTEITELASNNLEDNRAERADEIDTLHNNLASLLYTDGDGFMEMYRSATRLLRSESLTSEKKVEMKEKFVNFLKTRLAWVQAQIKK